MARIAFIGLGNMGAPMARNLQKAGHDLVVYDASPASVAHATSDGMKASSGAADAAGDADVVITMLPSGPIVLDVLERVLPHVKPDTLLIDCSTIDVDSARKAHAMAQDLQLSFLDAPVSGGIGGAAAATLTFMVGGTKEAFAHGRPILLAMGSNIIHCGDGGTGQVAKICNNMLLGISMIGACEAFALADKLGLNAKAAYDVISTSSGSCWSVNKYCPVPGVGPDSPADRGYKPGFSAELMLKDLALSQQAAEAVGQFTPMGQNAHALYSNFIAAGGAGKDFSGIIKHLRDASREQP